MRTDRCGVCDGPGADILCSRCGHIVCRDCYDEETKVCIDCSEDEIRRKIQRRKAVFLGGVFLLMLGLSTIAAGLVVGIQVEGVSIMFPFLIGSVSPLIAGLYSLLFFAAVGCASLIPWYIHTRHEQPPIEDEESYSLLEEKAEGGDGFEHVEYMITTELDRKLNKTITVEPRDEMVVLHSTADPGFRRSYPIPDGCDLEGLDYDYEGGYLVLRLHLVRSP